MFYKKIMYIHSNPYKYMFMYNTFVYIYIMCIYTVHIDIM